VTPIFAVCLTEPDVPVTTTVADPIFAALLAVNVSVLVLLVVAGLIVAVTPLGNTDVVNVTLPLKPSVGLSVIVAGELLLPCATFNDPGVIDKPKFGPAATTVSANFTGLIPAVVAEIATVPGFAEVV
jgi:hypothetical protein